MVINALKVLLVLSLMFLAIIFVISRSKTQTGNLANRSQISEVPQTPIPFANLTIPSLRAREYKSSLSNLEKYSENASYTTYLTSYNSDGLKINGLITIPKDKLVKHPAIVFVHGYIPPSIYKTTERYASHIDYLARSGFVVFKIDLRGHASSEGDPSGAYYSSGYVVDTLNAYSALQGADFVDKSKVGLWGHSMAGNVTFRSFVVQKNIPALVIWAGAVYSYNDLLKYRLNDQSYRPPTDRDRVNLERQKLREAWGEYSEDSSFWKQVVPTNYLEGVSGAVQLHHAQNDSVVNIGYSRDLISILDKTEIVHSLFEYGAGGHNIESPSFEKAMSETVSFYKRNLHVE